jgi:hypothetical protein
MKSHPPIFFSFLLISCTVICCTSVFLQKSHTIEVSTVPQFRAAVLKAGPGTIIETADGDYRFDDAPLMIKVKGTSDAPVIIRAKNTGKARFTGEYAFIMEGCSYVTMEGFTFFNRALKHSYPGVLDSDTDLGANRDEAPLWGAGSARFRSLSSHPAPYPARRARGVHPGAD